jgi:hypothetical protein
MTIYSRRFTASNPRIKIDMSHSIFGVLNEQYSGMLLLSKQKHKSTGILPQGAFAMDCPYEPPVGAIPCGCPSSWLFLLIKIPENLWFSTYIFTECEKQAM